MFQEHVIREMTKTCYVVRVFTNKEHANWDTEPHFQILVYAYENDV